MQTKIAIAFAVAVVLGVAFMVYRHVTKEEKKEAYVEKTFSQMTEAAQKSPKAGLSYMGMAIKKYHREHQKYPEQLALLYPEYIKDKGFIEEVDWEYQAQKDNFVLSKTVTVQGRYKTASIDKTLRPRSEEEKKQVRVAAKQKRTKPSAAPAKRQKPKTLAGKKEKASLEPARQLSKEELAKERKKLLESMLRDKNRPQFTLKSYEEETKKDTLFTVAGKASEVKDELGNKYLVWKNKDGTLGFGNVVYPELKNKLVYQRGQWLSPTDFSTDVLPETFEWRTSQAPAVADKYNKQFLTWKLKSGALGFGNVDYPEEAGKAVYRNGTWLEMEPATPERSGGHRLDLSIATDSQGLVKKIGETYFTWKDKSGALGFGNMGYPEHRSRAVYQNGNWLNIQPEQIEASDEKTQGVFPPERPENPLEQANYPFFSWKTEKGAWGFSNIDYPARDKVDDVNLLRSGKKKSEKSPKSNKTTGENHVNQ